MYMNGRDLINITSKAKGAESAPHARRG
jgi:hypothetical protein